MEKTLHVARQNHSFIYLPSGYKYRKNVKVVGLAKTGEVSPKGTVTETEDWEGRQSVLARPITIHMVFDKELGKFRPKTLRELIAEGKFFVGKGPTDFAQLEGAT